MCYKIGMRSKLGEEKNVYGCFHQLSRYFWVNEGRAEKNDKF